MSSLRAWQVWCNNSKQLESIGYCVLALLLQIFPVLLVPLNWVFSARLS